MQIKVSAKHMEVGESLHAHAVKKLTEGVTKYLERAIEASVVFHKENHHFHTDITVNLGTHSHLVLKASAEAPDAYDSFDAAAERVEKQLRRYKRKLKSHTEARKNREQDREFVKYVLSGVEEELPEEDGNPLVIAEQNYVLETLTVSEAVMRLDLGELPAVAFLNAIHGGLNVIYRRKDGNIAWLDPEAKENKKSLRKAS